MKLWAKKFSENSFLKNASWMVGGSSLQAGIAFISNVVLARHLMPEDFGTFAIIQANISISSAIINLKLGSYVIKLSQEELNSQYSTISTLAILLSFINTLIGYILLMFWGMISTGSVLLLIDKFVAPIVLLQLSIYERKSNYKGISLIETSANTISHIASMILVFSGVGMIMLYARVLIETFLRLVYLIRKKELRRMPLKIIHYAELNNIISQVKGFWLDSLMEGVFERLLILIGGAILSEKQLGYFVQAKRLAITPHQLLQPIAFRVSYNFFSKAKEARTKLAMLYKILLSEFAVLLTVGLIIFIGGDVIIKTLFGNKWVESVVVLKCMLGVVTFLTLFNTYKSYYMASHSMLTFFKLGRVLQFVVLLVAVAGFSLFTSETNLLNGLSLSYSLAYVVPVLILIGHSMMQGVIPVDNQNYAYLLKKKKSSTV
uniref:Oligosaccharide flippase family protein n=1 Tax=Roseihalotalea indica TaxID=2867963 RepID=A0AA49GL89_9BACT|nr:oligosaccharide flippase family protein [Tunicatimonas sp. TK19036]WKN34635.1 oligosaccharide flippase family protein [Tunicatimonas sp. TK19036]